MYRPLDLPLEKHRVHDLAHVVRGLWNSWNDDTFIHDKASGLYFDKNKLNILDHKGEFFTVRGPLNVPNSPQGEPVLIQAGASEDGRQLAAETAEVVFGASQTLEKPQKFYSDVKKRMVACERDPDGLKIMPGLSVSVGETHEKAVQKYEDLQDLIDPATGLQLLSQRMDYDFSGLDINEPVPEIAQNEIGGSRAELMLDMARREKLTIKDLYRRIAGARGHCHISGTPAEIADMMEEWLNHVGCD